MTGNGDQRPEIGAEGQRLEDRSHSPPECKPVQGLLESNRVAVVARAEQGQSRLGGSEHASQRQEGGGIDRDGGLAWHAPPAAMKNDRGKDAQDGASNPLERVQDQADGAHIRPAAELRPGRSPNALPRWHVHQCPVETAGHPLQTYWLVSRNSNRHDIHRP